MDKLPSSVFFQILNQLPDEDTVNLKLVNKQLYSLISTYHKTSIKPACEPFFCYECLKQFKNQKSINGHNHSEVLHLF